MKSEALRSSRVARLSGQHSAPSCGPGTLLHIFCTRVILRKSRSSEWNPNWQHLLEIVVCICYWLRRKRSYRFLCGKDSMYCGFGLKHGNAHLGLNVSKPQDSGDWAGFPRRGLKIYGNPQMDFAARMTGIASHRMSALVACTELNSLS